MSISIGSIIHVVVDAVSDRLGNVEHALAPAIVTGIDEELGKVYAHVFPNSPAAPQWVAGISIHDRLEDAIQAFVNPEHPGTDQLYKNAIDPTASDAPSIDPSTGAHAADPDDSVSDVLTSAPNTDAPAVATGDVTPTPAAPAVATGDVTPTPAGSSSGSAFDKI